MAKAIKAVALVVTAVAVVVATAGFAAPLLAGAGLAGAAAAAADTVVIGSLTAGGLAAIGTGLSLVGSLLDMTSGSQPNVGQTAAGSQLTWKRDPTVGIPYLMGRTATGGNIVLQDTNGENNKYLHTLTVLSGCGPVHSVGDFTADKVLVSFTTDGGEGAAGPYQNRMWMKAQLGVQDPGLAPMRWTATGSKDTPADHGGMPASFAEAKATGFAATLWGMEFDTKVFSSLPPPLWVVEGVRVYDPRLDSTYAGGSGACRYDDESTWVYSKNPYLHGLTWCIGRSVTVAGTTYKSLGVHAPITGIDIPAFVEGANVADANGWEVGGVIYSTDAKYDVLRAILIAGAGKPSKLGAKISCMVNAPRVSLATLTGGDSAGEVNITTTQSKRERINTIWPRYREEVQNWQIVPTAAPVTVPAYYATDRGQRTKEVEYTLCQSASQAATLARYDIENAREFGPIVIPCKPQWMGFGPGDCITLDESEWDLNGQKALITGREQDPATLAVTLTLISETDGKHAFALGQTGEPPPQPGLTASDRLTLPAPGSTAWAIVDNRIYGIDGTLTPAIVVEGETDNVNAVTLLLEHQVATLDPVTDPWIQGANKTATAYRLEDTAVGSGITYRVRLSYITVTGVPTQVLQLGEVTTANLIAYDAANVGGKPIDVVQIALDAIIALEQHVAGETVTANEAIGNYLQTQQDAVAAALAQANLAANATTQAALDIGTLQTRLTALTYIAGQAIGPIVTSLQTATDTLAENMSLLGEKDSAGDAFVLNDESVKVLSTGSYLVNVLSDIEASSAGNGASIVAEQTARIGADASIASSVTQEAANRGTAITAAANTLTLAYTAADSSLTTQIVNALAVANAASAASATETTNRAAADSAISSTVSTNTATIGALSSSVSINAAAIATATGQIYGSLTFTTSASTSDNQPIMTGLQILTAGGASPISEIVMSLDFLRVASPGHPGVTPFFYDATSGSLFTDTIIVRNGNIQSLAVDHLKILGGSVSYTNVVGNNGPFSGSPGQVLGMSFYTPDYATVYALFTAKQDYQGITPCSWGATINIDGNYVNSTGGGAGYTDAVSLAASEVNVGPGWHSVQAFWSGGNPNLLLEGTVLYLQAIYK